MSARVLAALFTTFLLASCAQTQGETCQLDEDCEGDLTCCKDESPTIPERGTCQTEAVCLMMRPAEVDAGPVEDGGPVEDAGAEDAGADEDAGSDEDAGAEDAGADAGSDEDAGTGTDAGSDAGQDAGLDSGA